MEPNQRYYERRALEETKAAARAVTPEGKERHRILAEGFRQRALECAQGGSWPYRGLGQPAAAEALSK
jgi:hypothetical protein